MLLERWVEIENTPGYSISDHGRVRNDDTNRIMKQFVNRGGVAYVSPYRQGRQITKSVSLMVAQAFVPVPIKPRYDTPFNTPINLDGDRTNNCVDNLMWRPRWFAIKYCRQFHESFNGRNMLVEVIGTGERLTSWEAATKYGLIHIDVLLSALNRGEWSVFPAVMFFRVV